MKRSRIPMLAFAGAVAALGLHGEPAGADSQRDIIQELDENGTDAAAVERRLVKVTTILAKADARLDAIEAVFIDNPDILPPSLVDNPDFLLPLATIQRQSEGFMASVEAVDDGTDTEALARRLGRVTSTVSAASRRIDAVAAGWTAPPEGDLPPGPCSAAIVADLQALTNAGETVASRAGELDACSQNASLLRRLGNVSVSLAGTSSRLDGIARGWAAPPDGDSVGIDDPNIRPALDAELDSIIAEASAVLATAEALKAGPSPHMTPPPEGDAPGP